MKIIGWLLCKVGDHRWTCAVDEGIKVKDIPGLHELMKRDPVAGFWKYATMYCKRCGHVYVR